MDVPEVDVDVLASFCEQGAVVIDVRMPDEYERAHVPGAVLMPLPDLPERVEELPEQDTVYVICGSGGRSARAVQFLLRQGLEAVNVAGGTRAWVEAGKPCTSGPDPG